MARLIIRTVVTLLLVAVWTTLLWRGYGSGWGFGAKPVAGDQHLVAVASPWLIPGPVASGLREGDLIDLRTLTRSQRVQIFSETARDDALPLVVTRANKKQAVTLRPLPWRPDAPEILLRSFALLYNLLGLLLLWRGRDWVAWGLAVYAIGYGIKDVVGLVAPLEAKAVLMVTLRGLRDTGLFAAMLALVRPSISARLSSMMLASMLSVVAVYMVLMLQGFATLVFDARYTTTLFAGDIAMTVASTLSAVVMVLGYRSSDEANRLRIRWFLVGTVLHALSFMVWGVTLFWYGITMALLAMGCFTYAALRHRLVDVSFAVSRTLVYGTVVALVVGVFAVAEHAIAGQAIGKEAGLILHLVVPLVLGITLHKVRERVEHVIERLLFRRQFDAERALLRLARESAYMEREDRLIVRTLHDIAQHARPSRVAFYLRCDIGYERAGQEGVPDWPARIDADDPAFVALRSGAQERGLPLYASVLGPGGLVFPMSIAGKLEGAIVCGDRAQQYTRVERELLGRVVHDVGVALHGLRARRSEILLEALARGTLTVREVREQVLRTTP